MIPRLACFVLLEEGEGKVGWEGRGKREGGCGEDSDVGERVVMRVMVVVVAVRDGQ